MLLIPRDILSFTYEEFLKLKINVLDPLKVTWTIETIRVYKLFYHIIMFKFSMER